VKAKPSKLNYEDCISSREMDSEFVSSALKISLDLLTFIVTSLWQDLPSCAEIFSQLKNTLLPGLDLKSMHPDLKSSVKKLKTQLDTIETQVTRSHLTQKKKAPIKMLKLYDPDLDDK
jgi:hypothetical protein